MNLEIRPDEVIGIYDNGGLTMDRYTVLVQGFVGEEVVEYTLTCNAFPFHGIGVTNEGMIDVDALDEDCSIYDEEFAKLVGEEIEWSELPEDVKMFASNITRNIYTL